MASQSPSAFSASSGGIATTASSENGTIGPIVPGLFSLLFVLVGITISMWLIVRRRRKSGKTIRKNVARAPVLNIADLAGASASGDLVGMGELGEQDVYGVMFGISKPQHMSGLRQPADMSRFQDDSLSVNDIESIVRTTTVASATSTHTLQRYPTRRSSLSLLRDLESNQGVFAHDPTEPLPAQTFPRTPVSATSTERQHQPLVSTSMMTPASNPAPNLPIITTDDESRWPPTPRTPATTYTHDAPSPLTIQPPRRTIIPPERDVKRMPSEPQLQTAPRRTVIPPEPKKDVNPPVVLANPTLNDGDFARLGEEAPPAFLNLGNTMSSSKAAMALQSRAAAAASGVAPGTDVHVLPAYGDEHAAPPLRGGSPLPPEFPGAVGREADLGMLLARGLVTIEEYKRLRRAMDEAEMEMDRAAETEDSSGAGGAGGRTTERTDSEGFEEPVVEEMGDGKRAKAEGD
ncbi:hypothetical protein HK101_007532 [Irineochytrium annulatum]|nr:hypothetical protein HK101_007532 [Irineochytrium annulatum]